MSDDAELVDQYERLQYNADLLTAASSEFLSWWLNTLDPAARVAAESSAMVVRLRRALQYMGRV